MDFFQLIDKRHSVRAFSNKPIPEEIVTRILEAANRAPSAGNLQAYEIIRVESSDNKTALARAAWEQNFIQEASVVFVVCANPDRSAQRYSERGRMLYCINDASIASAYIELASCALGLSSIWVGAFDEGAVSRIYGATISVALVWRHMSTCRAFLFEYLFDFLHPFFIPSPFFILP